MPSAADPIVTFADGAVRGLWRGESGNAGASAAFLGIPFAKPPVGDLRYAAPVPPEPWEGVRDAREHGATPQRGDTGITLIPEPSIPGDSTLNVDVFTPAPGDRGARLPVLVWIHGGAFIAGTPASPWYDGRAFNRDGVVTVTISYRLGFDGFGHIAGAPSNRGVRDWLAALEWVRDSIAAFGGDPGRVTIAGQSAGGGAVLTLLAMPAAQSLFHSALALSAPVSGVAPERAQALSSKLARLAGVMPIRAGFASVPEEKLRDLQLAAARPQSRDPLARVRGLLDQGLSWGPEIDGDLVPHAVLDGLAAGIGADKPLLLGAADDEFTMLLDSLRRPLRAVPAPVVLSLLHVRKDVRRAYLADNAPQRRKGTAAILGRYVTDVAFRSQVVRAATARQEADAATQTWVYRFSWPTPLRRWALHCLDLPFWFDCLHAPGVREVAGDAPPRRLAEAMHATAVAFVRGDGPGWTPWSAHPGTTRVFGGEASAPDVESDGYASVRALLS